MLVFFDDMISKYYDNSLYPIDSTALAQSILTLTRFSEYELAEKIALWAIQNMQSKKGYFYYQNHKLLKNKISYMRWSNAWMLLALSKLLYEKQSQKLDLND